MLRRDEGFFSLASSSWVSSSARREWLEGNIRFLVDGFFFFFFFVTIVCSKEYSLPEVGPSEEQWNEDVAEAEDGDC